MLTIKIPGRQYWNAAKAEFEYDAPTVLKMEHSLFSLSKWECKWHVPFLSDSEARTPEQMLDYYRCMTVTKGVDPAVYKRMTKENVQAIQKYISDPMTATWFKGEAKPNELAAGAKRPRHGGRRKSQVMTAEVIYAQMFASGVPLDCEKWHLNRLLTLLRVCAESSAPPKKMSRGERMSQQRLLNEQRRAKLGTRG